MRGGGVVAAGRQLDDSVDVAAFRRQVLADCKYGPFQSGGAIDLVEVEHDPLMGFLHAMPRPGLVLQGLIQMAFQQAPALVGVLGQGLGEFPHRVHLHAVRGDP
jgi:hypothetical protein